jgi:glucose-6-phosphate dehydrogenase assembly protein OpcA
MSRTLLPGWSFEEVHPGEIDHELERQRRSVDLGAPLVRASVNNLVVVTRSRAVGQQALGTVEALGPRAPSRCVVLIAQPPEGRPGVRAWARVAHRRPTGGPEVVWEEVVVQTNVHPRHLSAVVLPLLLPELPVFTWWVGTPPFAEEVFDELTSVTDRLVVDSGAFDDPEADLRELARVAGRGRPAVSDCAYGRLTPWRDLLAAPFGGPPLRDALDRIRWLRVDAVEPAAGLELVGWFAGRLGWRLEGVRVEGHARVADYDTRGPGCEVRLASALGSEPLTRVHLEADTQEGPASVRVEAPPGHLVATVEAPGQVTGRRKVGHTSGPDGVGLGAELELFGRDRVFEEALAEAARLAAAGAA